MKIGTVIISAPIITAKMFLKILAQAFCLIKYIKMINASIKIGNALVNLENAAIANVIPYRMEHLKLCSFSLYAKNLTAKYELQTRNGSIHSSTEFPPCPEI